jgi:hypothetical protein
LCRYASGDWVSLNGTTGEVIKGAADLAPPAISGDLGLFMSWVDGFRRLKAGLARTPLPGVCHSTPGCQIGGVDDTDFHQLNGFLPDALLCATPGCQISYMGHTVCHQLHVFDDCKITTW